MLILAQNCYLKACQETRGSAAPAIHVPQLVAPHPCQMPARATRPLPEAAKRVMTSGKS